MNRELWDVGKKLTWREICLIVLILWLISLFFRYEVQANGREYGEIDVSKDPVQVSPASPRSPIRIEDKDYVFIITPMADYKIAAQVASKKQYYFSEAAALAPVDLALIWGKLVEPAYEKQVRYSQGDRWYHYYVKPDGPLKDCSYVSGHSSNHHLIPGNENIRQAIIELIKAKQKIVIEGYLVNVRGEHKGRILNWNTSLSRSDTGDGACEVLYVKKVRIGDKIYR